MEQSIQVDQPVFIDGASVLVEDSPEYVVYQEIHESSKMYMRSESLALVLLLEIH